MYLATDDSYTSIANSFRIGVSTTSNIIHETTSAIWNVLQPIYLPTPTEQMWKEIGQGFGDRWQFPGCISAIDGKHCNFRAPPNSGSLYFNYKKTFSLVLLAMVDCKY